MAIPILQTIQVASIASDPISPSNGYMWYNSTTNQLKVCINGVNTVLGSSSGVSLATAVALAIAL